MSQQYFHFTIGPVQGFVAQARRTRDFWAGSFILSWLSAVAIKAVKQQKGTILFPQPNAKFLDAVTHGGKGPKQGSIPNRFKAKVPKDGFDPEKVTKAVKGAWEKLAEQVWKNDLAGIVAEDSNTKVIWKRQIENFWDIEWALVPEENTHDALDRLKNWRTYMPPDDPGVKCMMMEGWQELSGAERPGKQPQTFWNTVRDQKKTGIASDLRDGEMLCAIAFVKRRFIRYFKDFSHALDDGVKIKGWDLPKGAPSVTYLAAAHWLESILVQANEEAVLNAINAFQKDASNLTEQSEWTTDISCIRDLFKDNDTKQFATLNGEVFFEHALYNKRLWEEGKREDAKNLAGQLGSLQQAANIKPATPFYAVLLMDGDELGKNLKQHSKEIALGLGEFTEGVEKIVKDNSGFLVYAGGDDVLAILPLEDALPCATALRNYYADCFKGYPAVKTTLSGAIEYAHIKMPLGKILKDAHDLLDNVAKEQYGRDAIACRVWKPGDKPLEWAMPWDMALNKADQTVTYIQQLADQFQQRETHEDKQPKPENDKDTQAIANRFFYRIRHYFSLFESGDEPLDKTVLDLLAMEYIDSGLSKTKKNGRGKGNSGAFIQSMPTQAT
jgi:CRISPR-associated protein Cmr2